MNSVFRLVTVLCVLGIILWVGQNLDPSQADASRSAQLPRVSARRVGPDRAVVRTPTPRMPTVGLQRFDNPQATSTPTRTPTPINIGNRVWIDGDGDGIQDVGEPGLEGVAVQLWNVAKTALLDQTTTNASGIYTVVAPVPGDYRVRVVLPAGANFTLQDRGGDDQNDSDINPGGINAGFTDAITLAMNLISTTIYDAGIILPTTPTPTRTPTPINIGNFVWNDLNGDGVQTSGEPGVGGVAVQLWNSAKTQLLNATITNSSGIYSLVAPIPGDYRVRVVLPGGASLTLKDQGSNTLDSDINQFGIDAGFTDVFTIASNVISITSIDGGLTNVQPSPTPTMTSTPTETPQLDNRVHVPLVQR